MASAILMKPTNAVLRPLELDLCDLQGEKSEASCFRPLKVESQYSIDP